ncbi:hypothetical protein AB0J74_18900 [Asanoa sp. NPDC049573]|uniref:hypothetical protein n=1 Tax=Asanoa sp. NPDC049573 TaxID=3155396 RepID=UPI00341AC855
MTLLPAYRRVHLRILARAAVADTAHLALALARALAHHGPVDVYQHGPYHKEPELLEFTAVLEPTGRADECVAALRASATGWHDDEVGTVWARPPSRAELLDPAVEWLALYSAQAATLPRYGTGEIVRILASPLARGEDLVDHDAEVLSAAAPTVGSEPWSYAVMPLSWDTVIYFPEPDLAPTGRQVPPQGDPIPVLGVQPDATVTDHPTLVVPYR